VGNGGGGAVLGDIEGGGSGPADPHDLLGGERVDEGPAVFFGKECEEV
jgi:hypothetical protein